MVGVGLCDVSVGDVEEGDVSDDEFVYEDIARGMDGIRDHASGALGLVCA